MLPSLKNIGDLKGKKVLLRVDFNVPIAEGFVSDGADWRIKTVLPTLNYLSERGARIIILTHLGRPKNHDLRYSLYPVFEKLSQIWSKSSLFFSQDIFGMAAEKQIGKLENGQAVLLENLRFYKEEEINDEDFAKKLAKYGEIFVNDAFADSHRAHASIVGIPKFLKSYAGFLLEKEIAVLGLVRSKPRRPLIFIMGGAKADTKLKLIKEFADKSEAILLGGVLANTLLNAKGFGIGKSVIEESLIAEAKKIETVYKNIYLPMDVVVSKSLDVAKDFSVKPAKDVKPDEFVVDIGPNTVALFKKNLKAAGMIVWNGSVGYTELKAFRKGSLAIAQALAESMGEKIIGGGDLVSFLAEENLLSKMSYVSTGGGAMLEFLAGDELPGIKVLEE